MREENFEENKFLKKIENDFPYQRTEWKIRNVSWTIITLLLIAGIAGVFGNGIVSKNETKISDFKIEYERFLRLKLTSEILIHIEKESALRSITINHNYLNYIQIEKIMPEPKSIDSDDEGLVINFHKAEKGIIIISIIPQKPGSQKLMLKLNEEPVELTHFTYF